MLAVVLVPSIVCILPEVSQLVIRHRWTGPGPLLADSSDVLRDVASTLVEEAGTLLGTVKSGCICRLHKLEPFRLRVLASAGQIGQDSDRRNDLPANNQGASVPSKSCAVNAFLALKDFVD